MVYKFLFSSKVSLVSPGALAEMEWQSLLGAFDAEEEEQWKSLAVKRAFGVPALTHSVSAQDIHLNEKLLQQRETVPEPKEKTLHVQLLALRRNYRTR